MFRFLILSLFFLVNLDVSFSKEESSKNIAINGNFELPAINRLVPAWNFSAWKEDVGSSIVVDNTVSKSGKASLKLDVPILNDARAVQTLAVKPDHWYKFSAWIKTEGVDPDHVGANISILDSMEHSTDIRGNSDWNYVEVFGKTGSTQTSLMLLLRIGFYGDLSKGKAWFDDVIVSEVSSPHSNTAIMRLDRDSSADQDSIWRLPSFDAIRVYLSIIVSIGFLLLGWLFSTGRNFSLFKSLKGERNVVVMMCIVALILKLIIAAFSVGYKVDIGTFSAWAADLANIGPAGIYRKGYFIDYPPGYLYCLWGIGLLRELFHLDFNSSLFAMILKLPAIIADLGTASLLFVYFRKKMGISFSWMTALLYLFNPLTIVDSSVWGQVDSVFTLATLLAILLAEEKKIELSGICYVIAVLLKPQALLILPIFLYFFVKEMINKKNWLRGIVALLLTSVTLLILIAPFSKGHSPLWLFDLYLSTINGYDYLSLNAFNLYTLFGGNWLANSTNFAGIHIGFLAWFLLTPVLFYIISLLIRGKVRGKFFLCAGLFYLAFFILGPKMHERYLFPAIPILFFAALLLKDRRIWLLAVLLSVTSFLNIHLVYDEMVRTGSSGISSSNPFLLIISAANLSLLIMGLLWARKVLLLGANDPLIAFKSIDESSTKIDINRSKKKEKESKPIKWSLPPVNKGSWIALFLIIALYSIVAFWRLGNTKSPQTFWKPSQPGITTLFDFSEVVELTSLEYFWGLGSGEYQIEWSLDQKSWSAPTQLKNDNRFVELRWRSIPLQKQLRFMRIALISGDQEILELHLSRKDKSKSFTPKISSDDGDPNAMNLFDEPKTFSDGATYMNGMYFDEVYFARSGWETLRGIEASENTHPPFGKNIIAAGIKIFGMTPFGYRFFGTLSGVLMLFFIFGMARRLTRMNIIGLLAPLLFAVDFMHLTQTRIATIDSLALFFILGSYYFMLRYLQIPSIQEKYKEAYLSLFASGIMIGFAIATKWIGIYAGLGLALLYFIDFFTRPHFWKIKVIGMTVASFIIVPSICYFIAYIPLLSLPNHHFGDLIANQTGMYDYHSKLQATHPFSSSWYEWPIMTKPVWYFSESNPVTQMVSTIQAFGNPMIWIFGTLALPILFIFLLQQYKSDKYLLSSLLKSNWTIEKSCLFVIISASAVYLPWAISARKLVFIYHFFCTVPFIILALCLIAERVLTTNARPWHRYIPWAFAVVAVLFFIFYFPFISGETVSREWCNRLKSLTPWDLYF